MNDFDKNFHINFSPLYFVFAFMVFMLWASEAKADEIEEVVVVAEQSQEKVVEPEENISIISAILPAFTYPQGGYGGFVGFNERGAQTIHTAVFVNGIPANDPGAGWYDFGHDFAMGQTVKVISGSNSVMYGSGSMAGTVLIQDTIEKGITYRNKGSLEPTMLRVAPLDQLEFSMVDDSIGSVRNDNDEVDNYSNKAIRLNVNFGDFTIVGKFAEYEYDYDNCYDFNWGNYNDCLQDGERYNLAIRNDFMTIGRNYNNADYFTQDTLTYANESYRDFARFGNHMDLSKNLNIAFGVDVEKIYYNTTGFQNIQGFDEVSTEITEPGISYAEDDANKSRPLWTGGFIGTGEFDISYVGDGNFVLTEQNNKYTDENAGIYFSANANFVLDYNFGIRVGNDDQNALRLGIAKGPWFFNVGNSFRKPNLYELNGDSYVTGNPELEPEEAIGVELGYGAVSIFKYEFEQAIEYTPGSSTDITTTVQEFDSANSPVGCVLDPTWTENDAATFELIGCTYALVDKTNTTYIDPTYNNTGAYVTQGIRFNNTFGPVSLMLKYTDTEQTRIPKYAGALIYNQNFNGVDLMIKYAVQLDREPGPYDFLAEGEEFLEDLTKLDLVVTKEFTNGVTLSLRGENLTDEVVEVVPFYNTEGREVHLTLGYKW